MKKIMTLALLLGTQLVGNTFAASAIASGGMEGGLEVERKGRAALASMELVHVKRDIANYLQQVGVAVKASRTLMRMCIAEMTGKKPHLDPRELFQGALNSAKDLVKDDDTGYLDLWSGVVDDAITSELSLVDRMKELCSKSEPYIASSNDRIMTISVNFEQLVPIFPHLGKARDHMENMKSALKNSKFKSLKEDLLPRLLAAFEMARTVAEAPASGVGGSGDVFTPGTGMLGASMSPAAPAASSAAAAAVPAKRTDLGLPQVLGAGTVARGAAFFD